MKKLAFILTVIAICTIGCHSASTVRNQYGFSEDELYKKGIIILSPKNGFVSRESEIKLIVAISERFDVKRYFIHTYQDGQIVAHGEIQATVQLDDLSEGDHKVEIVIADHGHEDHIETEFRDSVSFIVEKSGHQISSSGFDQGVTFLKKGLGFATPEEALDALLALAVSQNKEEYEKVLGRPLEEGKSGKKMGKKMKHDMKGEKMKMKMKMDMKPKADIPSLTSILDAQVTTKGIETISGDECYYFISEQKWKFSDGSIQKKKFDLHFKKIDGRWIFYPLKGARFLLF